MDTIAIRSGQDILPSCLKKLFSHHRKLGHHERVEPHGQALGTTWFRRFASRTAGLSGATSRL